MSLAPLIEFAGGMALLGSGIGSVRHGSRIDSPCLACFTCGLICALMGVFVMAYGLLVTLR